MRSRKCSLRLELLRYFSIHLPRAPGERVARLGKLLRKGESLPFDLGECAQRARTVFRELVLGLVGERVSETRRDPHRDLSQVSRDDGRGGFRPLGERVRGLD